MRSSLRNLTFGLAVALAGATSAQYPYYLTLSGTVTNCYPGQTVNVQTVQGTQPAYDWDIPVDTNTCTWTVDLGINSNPAWWLVTTMCNGMVVSASDQVNFNFLMDSAFVFVMLDCGNNGNLDCNGVPNGPAQPGTPCDDGDPMTFNDLWTPACVCAGSDTTTVYDCLQIANGPNMPGTGCVTFFGTPGVWNPDCICIGDSINVTTDCLGIINGPNMPGTACDDNDPSTTVSWWSLDCVCTGDSGGTVYDCLQIPNGPNLPGTPCTVPGTVIEGTWSNACICVPNNTDPCEAGFWVLQAFGQDSMPVPYELWVWNLSSGGTGQFAFTWDFGDGQTSTEPFPTHTYDGNGPYNLCLTILDNNGCTDTYCDSISINADGIYEGFVVENEVRSDGFTINVQNPNANSVAEVTAIGDIATWPNPAVEELNVAVVSDMKGAARLTITDLNGRVVRDERVTLTGGRNQLRIPTSDLDAGMYLLRIGNGAANLSQRFVKTN